MPPELLTGALMAAGLPLLLCYLRRPRSASGLLPWHPPQFYFPLVWVFLAIGSGLILSVIVTLALLHFDLLGPHQERYTALPQYALLLGILGVLGGARRVHGIHAFGTLCNSRLSALATLKEAFSRFLWACLLVGLTYHLWRWLLHALQPDLLAEQDIITQLKNLEDPWAFTLLALSIVGLTPLVEELLFRGILYRWMRSYLKPLTAAALNSFVFALIHWNLQAFLPLFVLSLLLCLALEESGDIRLPILMHLFFNQHTLLLCMFPD